jgi:DUF4097 and DUF4098 domain-containing protein YvlB
MSDETFDQTFQVSAPASLVLSNLRGSVEVHPGPDGSLRVQATKLSHSGDAERTQVRISQEADGTVRAKTEFPDAGLNWLFGSQPCKVDYIVQAPRQCSLKINAVSADLQADGFEGEFSFNTVSGETSLRGLKGSLKLHTVSGDVELEDLAGELHCSTVSGDISGKDLSGPVHLDSVSGQVEIKAASLPSIQATTVSGDLEFETALEAGPYRFNSVSGDVHLRLPAETSCSAEIHSVSGGISTHLPVTATSGRHGHQSVQVQGGGVNIYVNSVSGDLSLGA